MRHHHHHGHGPDGQCRHDRDDSARRGHHGHREHGFDRDFDHGADEIRLGERGGPGLFEGGGRRGGRDEFGRGGGGRFFGPGDLRALLLWLIGEKPRHGYELIKAVEQLVGGAYSPSPGSVYPILSLLEDMEQIEATAPEGTKKLFAITDAGRQVLKDEAAAIEGLLSRMRIMARSMGGMRPPETVIQAMHTLRTAIGLHQQSWSEDESRRVSEILTRAIAEIQGEDKGEDKGGSDAPA